MQLFLRHNHGVMAALWLAASFLVGCGGTTVTPTFPTSSGLLRPDRVLVYDFAVTPDELDLNASGATGSLTQSQEDIRVGRELARALASSLVSELRSRDIEAYPASDAAPPGENTASVKGRFLRTNPRDGSTVAGFALGSGQVRTQLQIYQGTGIRLRLVAEGQTSTPSNLKSGLGNDAMRAAIEAEAKRTATQVADRFADYYKRQGWIK